MFCFTQTLPTVVVRLDDCGLLLDRVVDREQMRRYWCIFWALILAAGIVVVCRSSQICGMRSVVRFELCSAKYLLHAAAHLRVDVDCILAECETHLQDLVCC